MWAEEKKRLKKWLCDTLRVVDYGSVVQQWPVGGCTTFFERRRVLDPFTSFRTPSREHMTGGQNWRLHSRLQQQITTADYNSICTAICGCSRASSWMNIVGPVCVATHCSHDNVLLSVRTIFAEILLGTPPSFVLELFISARTVHGVGVVQWCLGTCV